MLDNINKERRCLHFGEQGPHRDRRTLVRAS